MKALIKYWADYPPPHLGIRAGFGLKRKDAPREQEKADANFVAMTGPTKGFDNLPLWAQQAMAEGKKHG